MSIFPADRRRELPDEPGVYLFRNDRGKVIYVGKAKSIKKRVASHFSNPSTRLGRDLVPMIDQIEALVVGPAPLGAARAVGIHVPPIRGPRAVRVLEAGHDRLRG